MPKALTLLKETFNEWSQDNVSRLAAALAYYTIFSLAPLLVIVISIVGMIFGRGHAQEEVSRQIEGLVGKQGAGIIGTMVENAGKTGSGLAMIVGLLLLFYGATNVFASLQNSLDTIWEVKPRPGLGIMQTVRSRLLSFAMVLGVAFLLMVSLILSAALSAATKYLGGQFPGLFWQAVELSSSFALFVAVFAAIYKVLPDVQIDWRPALVGGALTAVLFTVGKYLIGLYLGRSSAVSVYGAAGSLVVVLLWIYYASQILFIGAEFTQVYARSRGDAIRPSAAAVQITESERIHQGMPHDETIARAVVASEDARRDVVRLPVRVGPTTFITAAAALVAGFAVGGATRLFKSRDHAVRQALAQRTQDRIRDLHARLQQGEHLATLLRESDAHDRLDLLERRLKGVNPAAARNA